MSWPKEVSLNSRVMKKIYAALYSLLFYTCTTVGYSQGTASTNLSVELQSIQSITINEAQNNVAIALTNASEYLNGKSALQPDHIKIMSSSNYEIKVSAATHLTGQTSTIDIGTVTVTPTQGSVGGASTGIINLNPVALALGETTLVKSSQADAQRSFNVNYKVSGGQAYLNQPPGTYSTLVTYTILMP